MKKKTMVINYKFLHLTTYDLLSTREVDRKALLYKKNIYISPINTWGHCLFIFVCYLFSPNARIANWPLDSLTALVGRKNKGWRVKPEPFFLFILIPERQRLRLVNQGKQITACTFSDTFLAQNTQSHGRPRGENTGLASPWLQVHT